MLRGIGPGDPKLRNAVLVEVLEGAGLEDVRSVISSGNYVFRSDERNARRIERAIEAALHDHVGRPIPAIVRTRRQIEGLTRLDVFDGYDDGPTERCNVTFLQRRPSSSASMPEEGDGYRVLAVQRQCVFFLVDASRQKTPDVMAQLEKVYGSRITTRTWKTVHRIARAFES